MTTKKIFPIYRSEILRFCSLSLLYLVLSFNWSLLKSLKDIFIINNASASVIYYAKVGVLPFIFVYTLLYNTINRIFTKNTGFNLVICFFIFFYFFYLNFLNPYLDYFRLDHLADYLSNVFPKFKGLWDALRFWPLTLFYINAEAWGIFCLNIGFWTFVNSITSIEQSRRFYPFLFIGPKMALIFSGILLAIMKNRYNLLIKCIIICGFLALIIYNFFCYYFEIQSFSESFHSSQDQNNHNETNAFKLILKNPLLRNISLLILGYNMFNSLFESIFKVQLEGIAKIIPNYKTLLSDLYGLQSMITGCCTFFVIFLFNRIFLKKDWKFVALVTPIISLLLSICLFFILTYTYNIHFQNLMLKKTLLLWGLYMSIVNIGIIRASKYTIFDPNKERLYLCLAPIVQKQGKAIIDGFVSRLGKTLSSILLTVIIIPFLGNGSLENTQFYIFLFIFLIILIWFYAIRQIDKYMKEKHTDFY